MRKLLLAILLLVTITKVNAAQTENPKNGGSINKTEQTKDTVIKKDTSAKTGTTISSFTKTKTNINPANSKSELCGNCTLVWLLVCGPIVLFILGVWFINSRTKEFKLQDALTENTYPAETIQNPLYTVEELDKIQASPTLVQILTPTITVSDTSKGLIKSSSRYMAMLTATLTLIIAACLTSTFIYMYISTGTAPDFSHLGDVLLALGIGITPYAVNKVSTAVSSKP